MKHLLRLLTLFCLFGLFLACTSKKDEPVKEEKIELKDQATVIYVVRHAEKANNHPQDPDLSAAGKLRAQALKDTLSNVLLAAIYTTGYKRTQQTVAPIAQAKNLTPTQYLASDLNGLAASIRKAHQNQTVLIAGHSNTVLETIEAFQAQRPVAVVNDNDYNYLFKIILRENKAPEVKVMRYGN